jgi:general secretion pathway protein G
MRSSGRRGFTLLELLVVIGMIALLATILLPMVNHAYAVANRAAMAADLMVISEALDAYKHDFGDYPRLDRDQIHMNSEQLPPITGAALLCWALVAPGPALPQPVAGGIVNPGDGADGPGFRIRGITGPIKGPYLPPDRFLIGTADGVGRVQAPEMAIQSIAHGAHASFNDTQDVLADRSYRPILYYPATPGADPTFSPNGFVKPKYIPPKPSTVWTPAQHPALFYFDDNRIYLDVAHGPQPGNGNAADLTRGAGDAGWIVMSYRLGDITHDGVIESPEVPVTAGPYLLWSAGPNGIFGDDDDVMCDGSQLQQMGGELPAAIRPK